jgi:hypothetical protein
MMHLMVVMVILVGWTSMLLPIATAQPCEQGCVPCLDPRGCPDLTASENFLRAGLVLETKTYQGDECVVQEGKMLQL